MAQTEGMLSKGIKLSYADKGQSTFTDLDNLQEIPELGGDTEKVEVTTLMDAAHRYINGLLNYGDSVDFTFLYDKTIFEQVNALEDAVHTWKVTFPDGLTCTFDGESHAKVNAVGTNAPVQFTLSLAPNSSMVFA